MKVSELITKLKGYPPNAEVIVRKSTLDILDSDSIDYAPLKSINNVIFDTRDNLIYPPSPLFTNKTLKRMMIGITFESE